MVHNYTNFTGEYIKKVTEIDIAVTITTCCLSIIGAVIIFINLGRTYKRGEHISEPMKLLLYLTIADIFSAIGFLFGAIRFLYGDDISPEKVLACHLENDSGCIAQSFLTTMSSMSSFWWTSIIAFHLLWNSTDTDQSRSFNQSEHTRKGIQMFVYHLLSWAVPGAITITAMAKGILGSDLSVGSGAWCWISACLSDNERTIWMAVSGKGWEILISKRKHAQVDSSTPLIPTSNRPNEDIRFMYLWLIELCLRCFGTVRFIMAAIKRHTGYRSVHYEDVDIYLMHFQCFGDSAQALCSCLIFFGFR
ncbi:G protein-coupled receptor 157 [Mytilus galloprovincialis]|uniref:G protein-coupled receptor 157 n=1 Tax=Mytilus galloprovincialis TaxID=29158 RepID=A0A8B6GEG6_MYTGA|nr:G protein-coupled receptor 157 [Mytilus galloprovincialis]